MTCSAAYTLFPHPPHIGVSIDGIAPTLLLGLWDRRPRSSSVDGAGPPEIGRAARKFGRVVGESLVVDVEGGAGAEYEFTGVDGGGVEGPVLVTWFPKRKSGISTRPTIQSLTSGPILQVMTPRAVRLRFV